LRFKPFASLALVLEGRVVEFVGHSSHPDLVEALYLGKPAESRL
jgi:hypothetical protein